VLLYFPRIFGRPSRLSDLEVRVEFSSKTQPCKEGQPPDILLNGHFVPKKASKFVFFLREAEFQRMSEKGVHFFGVFMLIQLHSATWLDMSLASCK